MIRLAKKTKPQVLTDNAAQWTQVLLDRKAKNEKPTDAEKGRYRHPEIKASLIEETSGKCAYCESKVLHIAYGDVEHIVPKSTALEKTFEWENLMLACDVCNTNKANHFGNHESLVDPYAVEPTNHFFFFGPMLLPLPTSDPGVLTEFILKLNRSALISQRIEKIEYLSSLLRNIAKTQDPEIQVVLRKDLEINETTDAQEYAGLAGQFVKDAISKLPIPNMP